MASSTTGVAGQAVEYGSTEDTVTLAGASTHRHQLAGFLMQNVKDLDAGPVKGYRNLNNSEADLGDSVGVLQGAAVAFTKTYKGSPAAKDLLSTDAEGYLIVNSATSGTEIVAIVEAITSSATPSIEPTQTSTTPTDYIRIRILG